jgi:hypothetical protein
VRLSIGKLYRAGPGGVTVTWRDGSVSTYAARTIIVLDRLPLKVEGRLFRTTRTGALGYEAPRLEPVP